MTAKAIRNCKSEDPQGRETKTRSIHTTAVYTQRNEARKNPRQQSQAVELAEKKGKEIEIPAGLVSNDTKIKSATWRLQRAAFATTLRNALQQGCDWPALLGAVSPTDSVRKEIRTGLRDTLGAVKVLFLFLSITK